MVIFGGIDDDLNRLNDTWFYDMIKGKWQHIIVKISEFYLPRVRSGHSSSIYNDNYLVIFGGMTAVTKELDDVCVFDLQTHEWSQITHSKQTKSPVKTKNPIMSKLEKIMKRNLKV
jgi:N-acetylneuraminic acid mutarotase